VRRIPEPPAKGGERMEVMYERIANREAKGRCGSCILNI